MSEQELVNDLQQTSRVQLEEKINRYLEAGGAKAAAARLVLLLRREALRSNNDKMAVAPQTK